MNRKLIRPDLSEIKEQLATPTMPRAYRTRKPIPPEQTNAEGFYYKKQMDNRTPMVIVLQDGEELKGIIEWYDRSCIKLHRTGAPNLLVLKQNVKYMYKENESDEDQESEADVDADEHDPEQADDTD